MGRVLVGAWMILLSAAAATPVELKPVTAKLGMVVAAHPQAAEAGVAVLRAGGNAIDAAVATSLAVGVAEPYGSGLGGKLMLVYFEAKTGKTYVVDGMDAAGSLDVAAYRKRPEEDRSYGYGSVAVPGLAAALWTAHQKWGVRPFAEDVQPAVDLARNGFRILSKSRDFFAEQEAKLRRGDAEIARLYLPEGKLPEVGSLLPNEDLARTMERFGREGRDGFYRGPVAAAMVAASQQGGGVLTADDFATYEARVTEPIEVTFRGYRLVAAPPPTSGATSVFTALKVLEADDFGGGPLRTAGNLNRIGQVWRTVVPLVGRVVGDVPESRFNVEKLLAADSIAAIRAQVLAPVVPAKPMKAAWREDSPFFESAMAATTHFIVVDRAGNIVCATQSQSLHFGAGVVPPGTGVVMNDSMSNFSYSDPKSGNYVAPGRRARSTIAPTIVLRDGKPAFAIGIPGAARIPTALLQALLDRLVLGRSLAEAIGDTRFHYVTSARTDEGPSFEAERSFPAGEATALGGLGWKVALPEEAGRGRHFGGINAVEFNADGTFTGLADPRRTNVAVGW